MSDVITFQEACIYTTEQAAAILQYHAKTVRSLCRSGAIPARKERGGYRITGWVLRAYAENRLPVRENGKM